MAGSDVPLVIGYGDPLARPCPTCKAKAGQSCRTFLTDREPSHATRFVGAGINLRWYSAANLAQLTDKLAGAKLSDLVGNVAAAEKATDIVHAWLLNGQEAQDDSLPGSPSPPGA